MRSRNNYFRDDKPRNKTSVSILSVVRQDSKYIIVLLKRYDIPTNGDNNDTENPCLTRPVYGITSESIIQCIVRRDTFDAST